MTTLKQARAIASLPVKDPRWHSFTGEEYTNIISQKYAVINSKMHNVRLRTVCKVVEEKLIV